MGADLRDFLTGDERRQMDRLLEKAEERMKEKGGGELQWTVAFNGMSV